MTSQIPKIDTRSAKEIATRVKQKMERDIGIIGPHNDSLGIALIEIFSRFCEIIIERLNKVPEKNYKAFINELGISRNPPVAAKVPLTFKPVKGVGKAPIVVPQHTQVTAPPGEGENSPVVFETNQVLNLTTAELHKVMVLDSLENSFTDYNLLATQQDHSGAFLFKGNKPLGHELYIDIPETIATDKNASLRLFFSTKEQLPFSKSYFLEWLIVNDKEKLRVKPETDTTHDLTGSGEIVFNNLPKWEPSHIARQKRYWLCCRLITKPSSPGNASQSSLPIKLPAIKKILISANSTVEDTRVDCAIFNNSPVDLSKDFFPFGRNPAFGDAIYLSCSLFQQPETDITIKIQLTNPASAKNNPPIPRVNQQGEAEIQWEYWDGDHWKMLDSIDSTRALTEDGAVSFQIPPSAKKTQINGLEKLWIRIRLVSGDYGKAGNFEFATTHQNFNYLAATLAPPSIRSISVSAAKDIIKIKPEALITLNDFVFDNVDIEKSEAFRPFRFEPVPFKAFYIALKAGDSKILSNRWLDVYFCTNQNTDKLFYRGDQQFPALTWQYWNGETWSDCLVRDTTQFLNVTGTIAIFIAEDVARWEETSLTDDQGQALYWIRAIRVSDNFQSTAVLQKVLLNTTSASQVTTLHNEILGSSNGTPDQVFYTARAPILENPRLEVREPQLPSEAELNKIYREEGMDAITINRDTHGKIEDIWVRWHEVNDFLNSSFDRHYVIERLSGEIRFDDGLKGMLPPSGANNIRMQSYKTGGGRSGNKPENTITQLRTSVPLVDSVINPEASHGGQDSEDWDSVYARGSRYLRHRGRAVTREDFEDLALKASQQVARAKCFPLQDLSSDSSDAPRPGVISLIVVPDSLQPEPRPGSVLLREIWNYLDQVRDKSARLIIVGPKFVRINVEVVIVPATSTDIVSECRKLLENFLHPLTGGENSTGWDFGEVPHDSDLISLFETVPDVEFVKSCKISKEEEWPGLFEKGIFLISSGNHKIHLSS